MDSLTGKAEMPPLDSILKECAAAFRAAGGIRRCAIIQVENDLIHGCLRAGFDLHDPDYPPPNVKIYLKNYALLDRCVNQRQPILLKHPFEGKPPPLWEDVTHPNKVSAVSAIPILKGQQCLAMVGLVSEDPADELLENRFRIWQHLGALFSKIVSYDLAYADLLVERTKLEDILNGISHGIMVVDQNLRVLWANAFVGEMIGTGPTEQVGIPYKNLFGKIRIPGESSPVEESLAGGNIVHAIEHCPGKGQEPDRYLKLSSFPQKNSAGGVIHTIVYIRDVSAIVRAEMLQKDLVHMIVHDIRNPLQGAIQVLNLSVQGAHGRITKHHRNALEMTRDSSELLLCMLDDILDVYSHEAGKLHLNLQRIEPQVFIKKAYKAVEALAQERDIQLVFRLSSDLPPFWGDEIRLVRVMINLFDNAIKFAPKHSAVTVESQCNEQGQLQVSVTNSGRPIPPADLEKIYWKFYQVDKEPGIKEAGMGLGLAYCRLAIEAHGGRVWAESPIHPDGQGSRFTFTIPMNRPEGGLP